MRQRSSRRLVVALALPALVCGPAVPAWADTPAKPLVLAPKQPTPPPWPGPAVIVADVLAPAVPSMLMLLALTTYQPNGGALMGLLGATLIVPPALLVGWRERPFTTDGYFAAVSAGGLGLAAGAGLGFLLQPANSFDATSPWPRLACMAAGQGLGAALGYLVYQHAKPGLQGLDRLPEHRTDDPNNWDGWKERHHNE